MTRMANESDELTKNMNVTLLGDREKLLAVKRAVRVASLCLILE